MQKTYCDTLTTMLLKTDYKINYSKKKKRIGNPKLAILNPSPEIFRGRNKFVG